MVAHGARAHHVEAVRGLVEQDVLGVVHERTRQRHLGPLAVREAGGAAVRDVLHVEQREDLVDALGESRAAQALQLAVVADVLARGQPRIQAVDVRQHADAGLRAQGIPRRC